MLGQLIQLTGPDFVTAATQIASRLGTGSIAQLTVNGYTPASFASLRSALSLLKACFVNTACIRISTLQPLSAQSLQELSSAAGVPVALNTNFAALFQLKAADMQQAQIIQAQIVADARKQQMDRWKIMQETQRKILEITQNVATNKARTQDRVLPKWDDYIRR